MIFVSFQQKNASIKYLNAYYKKYVLVDILRHLNITLSINIKTDDVNIIYKSER